MNTLSAAQAVEALIQEYGKLVFHTIYGLTGDWEESQDLTQDTFHQAFKAIDAARAKSGEHFHAKAWLLRIALNTVLMQRRRRGLYRFIPLSWMQKEEQTGEGTASSAPALDTLHARAAAVQPGGYGMTESEDLETLVAEQDAVRRTLARLSEPLRVCLVLSIIGQFSSSEIARMLNLEEAAVRQRLARARKQFQQLYKLENGEEIYDLAADPHTAHSSASSTDNQMYHPERVEYREQQTHADPRSAITRRTNAQRFYRNPAVTPLR
ncbi:MAG TPA: sigma-70 family RNA polymerase sigma factor [Ktedonobacteraceae bacterium]|nr:sigma-70 family RNA polymerase sigma factor [Ktedonobacteraceae bacterium]